MWNCWFIIIVVYNIVVARIRWSKTLQWRRLTAHLVSNCKHEMYHSPCLHTVYNKHSYTFLDVRIHTHTRARAFLCSSIIVQTRTRAPVSGNCITATASAPSTEFRHVSLAKGSKRPGTTNKIVITFKRRLFQFSFASRSRWHHGIPLGQHGTSGSQYFPGSKHVVSERKDRCWDR